MTKSCVFCRVLDGEMPASVVVETDLVIAFLDVCPASAGHTLVLPRRHVESLSGLTSAELTQIALCSQRIAGALKRVAVPCEGITLSLADGAAAGQDIPHVHLHVIPRFSKDDLGWRAVGNPAQRAELDALSRQMKIALEAVSTV
jgi:histidine triad (HIT) family protein